MSNITAYVDGLCQPKNPGGVASYGFTIYSDHMKLTEKAGVIGKGSGMSNNVAEYAALCEALRWLLNQGLQNNEIAVKSDSRLLVNQMNGKWRLHKGLYANKFLEARKLALSFERISFLWISREENTEADGLTRKAYQEYCKADSR